MYETWLIPYLEGTLDAERRAQLEARLPDDPVLTSTLNTLRRTEPRLRAIAGRLRQSEAVRPAAASLWPALRGRLDTRPTRLLFGPVFWWTGGGLCAAGLLVFAVLVGPVMRPEAPDRTTVRGYKNAPLIVSHFDNAIGTPSAKRLRARALRVASERQAVSLKMPTLMAARPTPMPAPPHPPAALVPNARPLQMAEREPNLGLSFPVGLPPAPTHSPLPFAPTQPPLPAASSQAAPLASNSPAPTSPPPAAAAAPAGSDAPSSAVNAEVPQTLTDHGVAPLQRRSFALDNSVRIALPATTSLRQHLEQALTPPFYGTDAAETQRQETLRTAQQAGTLSALQMTLESEDAETQSIASARLLAVLDENVGDWETAAARWQHLVQRPEAVAEDWFQFAQAETQIGHADLARPAYTQALRPGPFPLSAAHRAIARQ